MELGSVSPSVLAPPSRRFSILFVEPDATLRDRLSALLEQRGYEVDECLDPAEALRMLESGHLPDLVLLDVDMPTLGRWETRMREVRPQPLPRIPVLSVSQSQPDLLDAVARQLETSQGERLQARTQELARLSSIGALSPETAHEINNPLAFVAGNLELARRRCAELSAGAQGADAAAPFKELDRLLHQAQRGAERIAGVVGSLALLGPPDQTRDLDVHELLETSLERIGKELDGRLHIERSYEAVPTVQGNPAKLSQALLHLLMEAVQFLAEGARQGDVLRLSTEHDESTAQVSVTLSAVPRQVTGGASAAGFARAGSAFRERMLQGSGARLEILPAPGLTFRLWFASSRARAQPAAPARAAETRRARLLVVDDEQLMCDLMTAMLGDDYDVVAMNNSREALQYLTRGESFDLVLCDLMMPDLTGMDLHTELARVRPDQAARMVFMTGGTFTERAYRFLAEPGRVQLQKPFRHDQLLSLVEARLAELSRSSALAVH
jgi:CheY-like chemotaxis protein